MRWVIIGPYPPEQGAGAALAAAEAARRLDAGDEVLAISPRPTAAHRHQPLTGRPALRALRSLIAPGDAVWARVEPGVLLTRGARQLDALLERVLLRVVLRRASRVVLDVGDLGLFPGGRAGQLVFGAADELVVHSPADRDRLVGAGAPASKVRVQLGPEAPAAPEEEPGGPDVARAPAPEAPPADGLRALGPAADRAAIEAAVRARAEQAPVRPARRS